LTNPDENAVLWIDVSCGLDWMPLGLLKYRGKVPFSGVSSEAVCGRRLSKFKNWILTLQGTTTTLDGPGVSCGVGLGAGDGVGVGLLTGVGGGEMTA
jgi:hypothetical protein